MLFRSMKKRSNNWPQSAAPQDAAASDDYRSPADGLRPAELSAATRDRLFARITGKISASLVKTSPMPRDWVAVSPHVSFKLLHRDFAQNVQTMLLRLAPGAVVPLHNHSTDEECWIVDGEVLIDGETIRAGDFHLARAGSTHRDFTSPKGATVLIRGEIPQDQRLR